MTDKQIIIDGYDVSECLFYQSNFEEDYDVKIKHFCSNWHNSCESANNSNCYFKQLQRSVVRIKDLEERIMGHSKTVEEYCDRLARKTQECEELSKENQQLRNSLSDSLMFKFTGQENETNRYRNALEEIEEVCLNDIHTFADGTAVRYDALDDILNIINKAKEEG